MRSTHGLRRIRLILELTALGGLASLVYAFPLQLTALATAGILLALAIAAEFLPVRLARHGMKLTLTLPFFAGIALVAGPLGAVVADAIVMVLANLIGPGRRTPARWFWARVNLANGMIASSIAGLATIGSWWTNANSPGQLIARAMLFSLAYGLVNLGLVLLINHRAGKSFEAKRHAIQLALVGVPVFAVLTAPVAVLIADNAVWALPTLLAPVIALRLVLRHHVRAMEHYYETITALTIMLQRAHPYTHGHLERVSRLAEDVAMRIGLGRERARMIREAAVLHDIGKIAIDEAILDKPAKLTDEEFAHVKLHAAFGADILDRCEYFKTMAPWIRHHHERPDGTGYPQKLLDDEIPVESKIIAVADAFDAMVGGVLPGEKRSYREPMSVTAALAELDRCTGTQFDGRVVGAFKLSVTEAGLI